MAINLKGNEDIADTLERAYEGFKTTVKKYPFKRDLMTKEHWANAWLYVSSGYCLLEQSLKTLIHCDDQTFDLEAMKKCGHSFSKMNDRLKRVRPEIREQMESAFRAYTSLHTYAQYQNIGEFLEAVDRDYEAWRYSLIETRTGEDTIEPTTVHLIEEVVRLVVWAMQKTLGRDDPLLTVEDGLDTRIRALWEEVGTAERLGREAELPMEEKQAAWERLREATFPEKDGNRSYINGFIYFIEKESTDRDLFPVDQIIEIAYDRMMSNIWIVQDFRRRIREEFEEGNGNLRELYDRIHFNQDACEYWDAEKKLFVKDQERFFRAWSGEEPPQSTAPGSESYRGRTTRGDTSQRGRLLGFRREKD